MHAPQLSCAREKAVRASPAKEPFIWLAFPSVERVWEITVAGMYTRGVNPVFAMFPGENIDRAQDAAHPSADKQYDREPESHETGKGWPHHTDAGPWPRTTSQRLSAEQRLFPSYCEFAHGQASDGSVGGSCVGLGRSHPLKGSSLPPAQQGHGGACSRYVDLPQSGWNPEEVGGFV